MKGMKKWIALLMASAMCVGMMIGCRNEEPTQTRQEETEQAEANNEETEQVDTQNDEVVEISFWDHNGSTAREEIFNVLIAEFEQENPGIKVQYVSVPSADAKSKYDVAIQSNTTPDCGGMAEYWMADFIIQDALYPLDDMINSWEGKDGMLEPVMNSVRSMSPEGQTFALAQNITLPAVWYNTQTMEAAGLSTPETWEDIFTAVEKTTDKAENKYGFSIRGGAGSSQQFEQMMYQYSGIQEMFDSNGDSTANAPEHVELLEKFASIYNVYTPESDVTNGYAEMISAFDTGSAAMIFHNLGSYGEHEKTLGIGNFGAVTTLESTKGTQVLVSNGSHVFGMFNTTEYPEETFKFISYLADHKASSYFSEQVGTMPCNNFALQDEWVSGLPHMKEVADALLSESAEVVTLPIEISGYYDLHNNELAESFQQVLLGNMSAQDYLDNWASKMTQLKTEYDTYVESME